MISDEDLIALISAKRSMDAAEFFSRHYEFVDEHLLEILEELESERRLSEWCMIPDNDEDIDLY